MIFERQEEEHDLHVALTERSTRAVMGMVAGASGWKAGVAQANEWKLLPEPGDGLPEVDAMIDAFGGGDGMAFTPDEIPGLEHAFDYLDRAA